MTKSTKRKSFFIFLRGRTMFDPTTRVVDGADPYKIKLKYIQQTKQKIYTSFRPRTRSIHARQPYYAGVQTMRARICSAFSCDMFARVVWLKSWRAQSRRLSLCPLQHALATHYFLRLTRARGRRFLRGWKILLNDFWYFSSLKSTIKCKRNKLKHTLFKKNNTTKG